MKSEAVEVRERRAHKRRSQKLCDAVIAAAVNRHGIRVKGRTKVQAVNDK